MPCSLHQPPPLRRPPPLRQKCNVVKFLSRWQPAQCRRLCTWKESSRGSGKGCARAITSRSLPVCLKAHRRPNRGVLPCGAFGTHSHSIAIFHRQPPALGFRIPAQSNAHGGTQSKGIKKASTDFRVGATELAARDCRADMQLVPCGRKGRTGSNRSTTLASSTFLWFVVRFLRHFCVP